MSHKGLELFSLCFAHSRAGAAGFDLLPGLPTAIQFSHNGVHGRGPYKRSRIGIPRGQKLRNRLLEIGHTDKYPTPNPFPGQFAKSAFDQIQPTGTGRNKMGNEARMPLKPTLPSGMFMRAVVVRHAMQLERGRKFLVQPLEKFQELLVPMPRIAFSDHFACGQLQRGKQRGRPVPLVIVGHHSSATALDYFAAVQSVLDDLEFRDGVLISAELGAGNQGSHRVLRQSWQPQPSWFQRISSWNSSAYTLRLDGRVEASFRALSEIEGHSLNQVANAAAQSADHIASFFARLRTKLGFTSAA